MKEDSLLAVIAIGIITWLYATYPSSPAAKEESVDIPKKASSNHSLICFAAISDLYPSAKSSVNIMEIDNNLIFISYKRWDNTNWSYECKLHGYRVIWRHIDNDKPWLNTKSESYVDFKEKEDGVTIIQRFPDGSVVGNFYSYTNLRTEVSTRK